MHLEGYEVFCAVVEYGSITKAAKHLHMTQSTASRHLRLLEDEFGVLLLERSPIKVELTALGATLYPYAADLLSCHTRAKSEIARLQHERGELCVGATFSVGEYLLPSMLGDFRRSFPEVQIQMRIANTSLVVEELTRHQVDIGIVEGIVPSGEVTTTPWREDELVLVCPPNHPFATQGQIRIDQLEEEPLLWREEGSGTRDIAERALKRAGVLPSLSRTMELGSTQAIKSAVQSGLGVAFLSRLTIEQEASLGTLVDVPIEGLQIFRTLYIVERPERYSNYMVEQFLQQLRRC